MAEDSYLDRAEGRDIGSLILLFFGAPILAFAEGTSQSIAAILAIFSSAATAIANGTSSFIAAFTADPANAMSDVIEYGVESMQTGWYANLGPFSILLFGGITIGMGWMFLQFLDSRNSDIPFTGTNVPFILGNDGDEE